MCIAGVGVATHIGKVKLWRGPLRSEPFRQSFICQQFILVALRHHKLLRDSQTTLKRLVSCADCSQHVDLDRHKHLVRAVLLVPDFVDAKNKTTVPCDFPTLEVLDGSTFAVLAVLEGSTFAVIRCGPIFIVRRTHLHRFAPVKMPR